MRLLIIALYSYIILNLSFVLCIHACNLIVHSGNTDRAEGFHLEGDCHHCWTVCVLSF